MTIGYCAKCKEKREMENVTVGTTKRGARVASGTCNLCRTRMSVMLPKDSSQNQVKEEARKPVRPAMASSPVSMTEMEQALEAEPEQFESHEIHQEQVITKQPVRYKMQDNLDSVQQPALSYEEMIKQKEIELQQMKMNKLKEDRQKLEEDQKKKLWEEYTHNKVITQPQYQNSIQPKEGVFWKVTTLLAILLLAVAIVSLKLKLI